MTLYVLAPKFVFNCSWLLCVHLQTNAGMRQRWQGKKCKSHSNWKNFPTFARTEIKFFFYSSPQQTTEKPCWGDGRKSHFSGCVLKIIRWQKYIGDCISNGHSCLAFHIIHIPRLNTFYFSFVVFTGYKFIACKLNWNQEHRAEPSINVNVKFACYCFSPIKSLFMHNGTALIHLLSQRGYCERER